jgi:hypothetical protein
LDRFLQPGIRTREVQANRTGTEVSYAQLEQEKKRLRDLIAEGLTSGPAQAPTAQRVAKLKAQALGPKRQ